MTRTSLYIVFILALLSAIIYFGDSPPRILGTSPALHTEVDAVPFAVARNTTTTHFQDDGGLSYTFDAVKLEHYRTQDEDEAQEIFTLIDKPQLVFYQDKEPWLVLANKGKITSLNERIELWNNVVVKHTDADGITTTITTQRLNVDPIGKVAETAEAVKINSDSVEIKGTGLHADFVAQKLKLLSKVRGLYDPT
ncbi:LPS export ABC transporter periplasmic protein LptC [Agarilytica rhodophyticola]|uniref:LPS export ABC transporter periplasmic protein LptC n=1 Tax=Agarilytica rhodophyticola TaxID=1737490 RepID=UPI000B34714E|nr:LPS export ABC transporter periplasmic protein LptC [Agarilytica rhodophyticola]